MANDDQKSKYDLAPELPKTIDDLLALRTGKLVRTLNDEVESVLKLLYADMTPYRPDVENSPSWSEHFKDLLWATDDGMAVEGSTAADNFKAADVLREYAKKIGNALVAKQKWATLARSMNVVLRRYKQTRKQRKNMLGGVNVPPDNGNDDTEE